MTAAGCCAKSDEPLVASLIPGLVSPDPTMTKIRPAFNGISHHRIQSPLTSGMQADAPTCMITAAEPLVWSRATDRLYPTQADLELLFCPPSGPAERRYTPCLLTSACCSAR